MLNRNTIDLPLAAVPPDPPSKPNAAGLVVVVEKLVPVVLTGVPENPFSSVFDVPVAGRNQLDEPFDPSK
jgi:hypothetical protein